MARPSQNVDQLLLDAGLDLLPSTGCAGLSVRRLCEHAGVNLGMFHYHFRNKDNFIRAVLQRVYEEMFSALSLQVSAARSPTQNLREALTTLVRFGRDKRRLLLRIAVDAMAGDALAADFLRANLPRHLGVVAGMVAQGQAEGLLAKGPPQELVAFLFGAVGAPVFIATAAQLHATAALAETLEQHVLSDAAIARRVEFALRGLALHSGVAS